MSVAVVTDIDPAAAHAAVRVPKLAVRNRSADNNGDLLARPATSATTATEGSGGSAGVPSESSSLRAPTPPGGRRRLSDQSGGSGSSGLARRNAAAARSQSTIKPVAPAKKKKNGMLGFFTMKEPSAMALEEFAEAQRQKAKEKGSSTVNLSGVSSRKLPEHVPKVNSKWDGLPENAKKQSSEGRSLRSRGDSTATATSAGRRPSTQHSGWSNRSDEAKRPFGSLSSRPQQSPQLPQRSALQYRASTHSTQAPILNSNLHPALRPIAVEETPENLPQTFLHPPSPPATRYSHPRQHLSRTSMHELPASFGAVPELETSDGPLPELESSFIAAQELDALRASRDVTPVPKSPITPSVDDANASNYYGSAAGGAGDASTTFFYSQSDTDHSDFAPRDGTTNVATSSNPKHLRQPINFSRRRTGKARPPSLGKLPEAPIVQPSATGFTFLNAATGEEEAPSMSPTLKNAEGRIDPFLTDTFAAVSRETGRIVERSGARQGQWSSTAAGAGVGAEDDPARASMSTYVSTTTATGGVQSPVFSTAPTDEDSTRPSTAASWGSSAGTRVPGDEYRQQQQHQRFPFENRRDGDGDDVLPDEPDFEEEGDDCGPDAYYTTLRPPHPPFAPTAAGASALRPSASASSLTPSTMSAQWNLSPKERLGLGGPKLRKDEAIRRSAPWEEEEGDMVRRLRERNNRISVASGGGEGMGTPLTPTEGKFKRLSYRFGGGGGGEKGRK